MMRGNNPMHGTRTDTISRRRFLTGSAAAAGITLSGCASVGNDTGAQPRFGDLRFPRFRGQQSPERVATPSKRQYAQIYGPLPDEEFPIPAIDIDKVPEQFWRREVAYTGGEAPRTDVVDTSTFYLYHVGDGGSAMRYGVGLGRQGFAWSGRAVIAWKRKWPTWTPPDEMIARKPELEKYSVRNGGMAPGLNNPLGARALYIHQNGVDTLYRVHGTPEYWTIGKAVSSGCVRMMNQDVVHLYEHVRNGSPILVR